MAKAFRHMKPVPRLDSWLQQRVAELEKKIDVLQAELEMWGEEIVGGLVEAAGAADNGIKKLIADRRGQIGEELGALSVECMQWNRFRAWLRAHANLCQKCRSSGEKTFEAPPGTDHEGRRPCESCGGSGIAKGASESVQKA